MISALKPNIDMRPYNGPALAGCPDLRLIQHCASQTVEPYVAHVQSASCILRAGARS